MSFFNRHVECRPLSSGVQGQNSGNRNGWASQNAMIGSGTLEDPFRPFNPNQHGSYQRVVGPYQFGGPSYTVKSFQSVNRSQFPNNPYLNPPPTATPNMSTWTSPAFTHHSAPAAGPAGPANNASQTDRVVTITPFGSDNSDFGVKITDTELDKEWTITNKCRTVVGQVWGDISGFETGDQPTPAAGQVSGTGAAIVCTDPTRTVTVLGPAPFSNVTVVYRRGQMGMYHHIDGFGDVAIETKKKMVFRNDEGAKVWIQGRDDNSVVITFKKPTS